MKFINPITDFGFKHIFKDEEITRGFLNALIQKYDPTTHIKSVTIVDGEIDETSKDSHRVVYDVHCTTDNDEHFVIEMQNEPQTFCSERIVYYLSRAILYQQGKGYIEYIDANGEKQKKPWNYHLKKIYGVFFMNFKDADPDRQQGLSRFAFMETDKMYRDSDVLQYWKIQMPIYRKMKESDCQNDIDKWIFNIANMPEMKTQLAFTDEIPLFKRLEQIASYSDLSPQQQIQYDDSFNNYLAYMGQQEYKLQEGIKIGRAEGEKIGVEKGAKSASIAIARKLKAKNASIDDIAELTGLAISEIQNL